ncbi:hypothetical protein Slin15195_G089870 [Septoria linicola]|uniref:Uncharacterized protein n=1 Tax=Septoria linicola TaxID=215465 RepID=A0A9Q9ENP0_9PEZI|nr:hypothetical protein Slin14017_G092540 [Septoria linicola]USW55668.1 hypothetical protein Slin15195_G089870 [Septoria linicola]
MQSAYHFGKPGSLEDDNETAGTAAARPTPGSAEVLYRMASDFCWRAVIILLSIELKVQILKVLHILEYFNMATASDPNAISAGNGVFPPGHRLLARHSPLWRPPCFGNLGGAEWPDEASSVSGGASSMSFGGVSGVHFPNAGETHTNFGFNDEQGNEESQDFPGPADGGEAIVEEPAEVANERFCCVWNHSSGHAHDEHCSTRHRFVARLRRHHEKHMFFYCTVCFLTFDSKDDRRRHGPHCGRFKCVNPVCVNCGQYPADTQVECNHPAGKNKQPDIYREVCRIAIAKFKLVFTFAAAQSLGLVDWEHNDTSTSFGEDAMELDDHLPAESDAGARHGPQSDALPGATPATAARLEGSRDSPVSTLLQEAEDFVKLLRVLHRRRTIPNRATELVILIASFMMRICRDVMLERLRETTSRLSADTQAQILVLATIAARSGAVSDRSTQNNGVAGSSNNVDVFGVQSSHVPEPQSTEDLLLNIGSRFTRTPRPAVPISLDDYLSPRNLSPYHGHRPYVPSQQQASSFEESFGEDVE